jgi:hypothetical protein
MNKLFTRKISIIAVVITLVVLVIYLRTGREMSEGDKTMVRQFLVEHKDSISTLPFLVYGEFKKVTSDEDILREVLLASKANDTDKLNKILDNL